MAELLNILAEQYDYPQLAEDVLRSALLISTNEIALIDGSRDLSGKEFNSNDLKGPKSVSAFISRLSEVAPRLVIKQMTSLAKFLDTDVSEDDLL